MARIAFVSPIPEFDLMVKNDTLKVHTTVDPFTGSSITYREPIALEYIDACCRREGHETQLFTETYMTSSQMLEELYAFDPDVVGISVHSAVVYPDTVSVAHEIKRRNPRALVVLGGYHPTGEIMEYSQGNLDRTLLHSDDVDCVVVGEGEETFVELVNIYEGNGSFGNVRGLAYKEDGEIKVNNRRQRVDFPSLPWPTRYEEVIRYSRCAPLAYPSPDNQNAAAQISGSRGCVYGCDFCSSMTIWPARKKGSFGRFNGEPIVQYRQPADIIAEIEYLREAFGVNFLTFTDLTFNFNPDYVYELCGQMKKRSVGHRPKGNNDMGWFAYATIDRTVRYPNTIEAMAEAGCSRIGIGLESLHKDILKDHKPNNTFEDEVEALRIVNSQGILNRSYLMVGWPEETPAMFDRTREILMSGILPVDQLRIAFAVPFLGTGIFSRYKDRITIFDWTKFTGDVPVLKNDTMSSEEMKSRVKDMLVSFYTSRSYKEHIRDKIRKFPHLRESFEYWQQYLQKRGIIPESYSFVE